MINFYCPLGQSPNGGHKVIYNTVEELNSLGVNARVLHPIPKYRVKWFDTKAEVNIYKNIKSSEYFIIPEVCLSFLYEYEIFKYSKYSILVQNGYYFLGTENSQKNIKSSYENADFIFCVSQDTVEVLLMLYPNLSEKIILFEPSMNRICSESFEPPKTKIITYMPRKNPVYSDIVVNLLNNSNISKKWEIIAIDGQTENVVIELLKKSSIFLNFSGLEGNPAPPLEAAALGNIVIGNHGNGGFHYWHEPLFIKVNQDDLKGYVIKTLETIKKIDLNIANKVNHEDCRLDLISSLNKRVTLSSVISNLVSLNQIEKSILKDDGGHFYSLTLIRYLLWRIKMKLNLRNK